MEIERLHTSIMRTNTYIVYNGDRVIVIDPGASAERIFAHAKAKGARIEAILLTHAHFDHIGGVKELKDLAEEDGEGAEVIMHAAELDFIGSVKNLGEHMGKPAPPFTPDILLKGGETLTIAGLRVRAIHTPGHSPGGLCFVINDVLFSGDTLFRATYGRTDLYDASFVELKNSIVNKLFRLKGEYRVLPGHGEESSLEFERRNNMILNDRD